MKKAVMFFFTYLLPAILGLILVYFTFRKVNINQIYLALKTGNYMVIIPVLLVSIAVYILRVLRWNLLFNTINIKVKKSSLFTALSIGYLVNFAVPRLGEITRAVILKRTNNVNANHSLSTIVFERLVDTICLALIFIAVIVSEYFFNGQLINQFINFNQIGVINKLIILVVIVIAGIAIYKLTFKLNNKAAKWVQELITTAFKLIKVKKPFWFLMYTIGIWLGFYLMTYLWFNMFNESAGLTFYQAYLVMFLGVVARSLPIQAGSAGAYHFVVATSLVFFGISIQIATTLSIVIHGFQSILTLFLGLCAYLWLLLKQQNA